MPKIIDLFNYIYLKMQIAFMIKQITGEIVSYEISKTYIDKEVIHLNIYVVFVFPVNNIKIKLDL